MSELNFDSNFHGNGNLRQQLQPYARPADNNDKAWIGEEAMIIDVKSHLIQDKSDKSSFFSGVTYFIDGTSTRGRFRRVVDYPFNYKEIPSDNVDSQKSFFSDLISVPNYYFHVIGEKGEHTWEAIQIARFCFNYNEGKYSLSIWNQENNLHKIPIEVEELRNLLINMHGESLIISGYLLQTNVEEANKHLKLKHKMWKNSVFSKQFKEILQGDLDLETACSRLATITKTNKTQDTED